MGKKSRIRQGRKRKEAEKEAANKEEIDRQRLGSRNELRIALEATPCTQEETDLALANERQYPGTKNKWSDGWWRYRGHK